MKNVLLIVIISKFTSVLFCQSVLVKNGNMGIGGEFSLRSGSFSGYAINIKGTAPRFELSGGIVSNGSTTEYPISAEILLLKPNEKQRFGLSLVGTNVGENLFFGTNAYIDLNLANQTSKFFITGGLFYRKNANNYNFGFLYAYKLSNINIILSYNRIFSSLPYGSGHTTSNGFSIGFQHLLALNG